VSAGTSTQVGQYFLRDLTALLRAGDPYGRLDGVEPAQLLRPFLSLVEPAEPAGQLCTVDALVVERLRSFYQAVAAGVERIGHVLTAVLVDVNGEGFGRVLVVAGRLVLLAESVRDAGGFGFPSLPALAAAGDRLVARAVTVLDRYPEVAGADD
jgi:probable nitrogen fixation protein